MALTSVDIARLFDLCANDLTTFFVRRTLEPDTSVELLGETFAAAFISRGQCHAQDENARLAWLYGIARNLLVDYFRHGAVERRALERIGVEPSTLTDAEYDRIEEMIAAESLHELVSAELDSLPADQRDAVRMRVIEEQSYAAVANALSITEHTARARVSRALRTIRQSPRLTELREVS